MTYDKSIIRTQKNRENPYVMIDKTFLSDDRLSWKSKGLLAYFLSKPDNWRILVADLIKQSTDGEKAIRSGLKELEKFGYLENKPVKNEMNRIMYWEKIIYERPIIPDAQNGKVDGETSQEPDAGFVHVEFVHVENAGLLNNDLTNKRNEIKNEKNNNNNTVTAETKTAAAKVQEKTVVVGSSSNLETTPQKEQKISSKQADKVKRFMKSQNIEFSDYTLKTLLTNADDNADKVIQAIQYSIAADAVNVIGMAISVLQRNITGKAKQAAHEFVGQVSAAAPAANSVANYIDRLKKAGL